MNVYALLKGELWHFSTRLCIISMGVAVYANDRYLLHVVTFVGQMTHLTFYICAPESLGNNNCGHISHYVPKCAQIEMRFKSGYVLL